MKKTSILLLIIIQCSVSAQVTIPINLQGVVNKKITSQITQGSKVEIIELTDNIDPNPNNPAYSSQSVKILIDGNHEIINLKQVDRIDVQYNNIKEFWIYQALQHSTYKNLLSKGFQYDLRKDLEEDAIEYLNYIKKNNLSFEDSYLESYLHSLIYKIYPISILDGRPGILNIKILKDFTPNAFVFPNGTMFVTTGLLSTINSEEELIGILAHEIAHFVLDHSIVNINKAIQRQKNAEFWAAFATIAAAVTEGYIASKNSYYVPGALTYSTSILALNIANAIKDRLGLKYSREQELEADRCAVELMKFISVDPLALASALNKIKNYNILNGNYIALTNEGTHPAIDDRINEIGKPIIFNDEAYDRKISFVNTFNAAVELNSQHFISCIDLAQRNIAANVATEDDYLLKATAILKMYDNEQKNLEAYNLIQEAKTLDILPSLFLTKQESIALIRLNNLSQAKLSILKYIEEIETEKQIQDKTLDVSLRKIMNDFLNEEFKWAVKMVHKVEKL